MWGPAVEVLIYPVWDLLSHYTATIDWCIIHHIPSVAVAVTTHGDNICGEIDFGEFVLASGKRNISLLDDFLTIHKGQECSQRSLLLWSLWSHHSPDVQGLQSTQGAFTTPHGRCIVRAVPEHFYHSCPPPLFTASLDQWVPTGLVWLIADQTYCRVFPLGRQV